jgi:hypothetical protein
MMSSGGLALSLKMAASLDQFGVGSLVNDQTVIEHEYLIEIARCRESVRD